MKEFQFRYLKDHSSLMVLVIECYLKFSEASIFCIYLLILLVAGWKNRSRSKAYWNSQFRGPDAWGIKEIWHNYCPWSVCTSSSAFLCCPYGHGC